MRSGAPSAGKGHLRPERRRRLARRLAHRPPRHRRPADLRFRRQRASPQGPVRDPDGRVPPEAPPQGGRRRRRGHFPPPAAERDLPGAEEKNHRPRLYRHLRGARRGKIGGARFLAQGTIYPDVIESAPGQGPVGDDQVAPQRRRPAQGPELRAGRAAPRAVQGRGPRPGGRAGRRPRVHRPASFSRVRGWPSASWATSPPNGSPSSARPTGSCSKRCGGTASITGCGRPSPSSCRCGRSASWGTSGPTSRSSSSASSRASTA